MTGTGAGRPFDPSANARRVPVPDHRAPREAPTAPKPGASPEPRLSDLRLPVASGFPAHPQLAPRRCGATEDGRRGLYLVLGLSAEGTRRRCGGSGSGHVAGSVVGLRTTCWPAQLIRLRYAAVATPPNEPRSQRLGRGIVESQNGGRNAEVVRICADTFDSRALDAPRVRRGFRAYHRRSYGG